MNARVYDLRSVTASHRICIRHHRWDHKPNPGARMPHGHKESFLNVNDLNKKEEHAHVRRQLERVGARHERLVVVEQRVERLDGRAVEPSEPKKKGRESQPRKVTDSYKYPLSLSRVRVFGQRGFAFFEFITTTTTIQ